MDQQRIQNRFVTVYLLIRILIFTVIIKVVSHIVSQLPLQGKAVYGTIITVCVRARTRHL